MQGAPPPLTCHTPTTALAMRIRRMTKGSTKAVTVSSPSSNQASTYSVGGLETVKSRERTTTGTCQRERESKLSKDLELYFQASKRLSFMLCHPPFSFFLFCIILLDDSLFHYLISVSHNSLRHLTPSLFSAEALPFLP